MATNLVHTRAEELKAVVSGGVDGAPGVLGKIPVVYLTTADSNNILTSKRNGVFNLSVKGIDGSGNLAINNGDILYYTSGDTPPLSAKATGVRFGYAYDETKAPGAAVVTSGSTATIPVLLGY